MTIDLSSPLSSALAYVAMGLSVFPLAPKEKKPPKQFKWESFQHKLPTKEQVKSWFDGTDNNIAIATGVASRLLAFDVDGATAKFRADDVIQNKICQDTRDALADTLIVQTGGGGFHLLVRYNPEDFKQDDPLSDEIRNAVLWRGKDGHSEIRLKGDGGYIVAAPSTHPTGNSYRLLRGSSIAHLSKEQILELIRAFRPIGGGSSNRTAQNDAADEQNDSDNRGRRLSFPAIPLDEERVMDVVAILRHHYLKGQRHDFILFLSGWLRKEGIAIESAQKIVEGLAEHDEELQDRLTTLEGSYKKGSPDEVKGFSGLLEILQAQLGSAHTAHQILKEVQSVFPEKGTGSGETGSIGTRDDHGSGGNKPPSASEIAIGLVDGRAVLYFNDEYGSPHIKVQVGEHTETMPVGSSRFELYVSKVFYDEMGGQVLKAESLNEVIRILTARTAFEGITAKLHLRSAWGVGERNEPDYSTLYYDPTTPTWSCIKVTTQGWEILPRHPESVLFTRFKQLPQAIPFRDYALEVMDRYLDLMHIKGRVARLFVRVLLIASFIPDIGHPITVPNGEQGGVKSTYCRYHKRLVDPCAVELLTIPKDRNEFVQHMHHNYVVVYDNVRIVPSWFSDEICKAVTGAGNSKRRLYTTMKTWPTTTSAVFWLMASTMF
jgi:Bifunctional DNA primase/polymerase, N-terminal